MSMNRRDLLKAGFAAAPLGFLNTSLSRLAGIAPALNANRRLLTIFLRGGNDGVNAVIPWADPGYGGTGTVRPNIRLDCTSSTLGCLPLAGPGVNAGGLFLHPSLGGLHGLWQADKVALLHAVGNDKSERSHFTEQHLLETGRQDFQAGAPGWVPGAVDRLYPQAANSPILPALSLSPRLMRMYYGNAERSIHLQAPYGTSGSSRVLQVPFADPNLSAAERVATRAEAATQAALTGGVLSPLGAELRSSNLKAFDVRRNMPAQFARRGDLFPSAPGDGVPPYFQASPAEFDKYRSFFARLEEAVFMLASGNSMVAGVELGGWDTHDGQVGAGVGVFYPEKGRHGSLLAALDQALTGAYDAIAASPTLSTDDFMILVVSEFGRTKAENENGTDHGVGGLVMAVGDRASSGVYNCHLPASQTHTGQAMGDPALGAAWDRLDQAPAGGPANATGVATDFRVPMIEILDRFFGFQPSDLASLPEIGSLWSRIAQFQGSLPSQFEYLGFV